MSSIDAVARTRAVYCEGELLDAIQHAKLFVDSKHFVDMPMRKDPEEILSAFEALPASDRTDPDKLRKFVDEHFDEPGAELIEYKPVDCPPEPPLQAHVSDPKLKVFLKAQHELWPTLCRTLSPNVLEAPHRYSALVRRNPVVLPGGRFRETYYWDSFWIVEGLIASGMVETAKGLVQNLLNDVNDFGFVPNGGRVYYLNRSQPPFLCDMVACVARVLDPAPASEWIASAVPLLQKEHAWWMSGGRAVRLGDHVLNRYNASWHSPRPESYREDVETAAGDSNVYHEIATGAETGWDYSCRWTRVGGRLNGTFSLREIATSSVLPVDLNSILYRAELTLAALIESGATGSRLVDIEAALSSGGKLTDLVAISFHDAAAKRQRLMDTFMWHATLGRWVDIWLPETYDPSNAFEADVAAISAEALERAPTLADFAAPLWAGLMSADSSWGPTVVTKFKESKLVGEAGAATTVRNTGQQWDAPNAWPPLQAMIIEGLRKLPPSSNGPALAKELAQKWIGTCYLAWHRSGYMHEKYNVEQFGFGGAGGEYEPQVGFGWSNGVVLQLLRDYGNELVAPEC